MTPEEGKGIGMEEKRRTMDRRMKMKAPGVRLQGRVTEGEVRP